MQAERISPSSVSVTATPLSKSFDVRISPMVNVHMEPTAATAEFALQRDVPDSLHPKFPSARVSLVRRHLHSPRCPAFLPSAPVTRLHKADTVHVAIVTWQPRGVFSTSIYKLSK